MQSMRRSVTIVLLSLQYFQQRFLSIATNIVDTFCDTLVGWAAGRASDL